MTSTTSATGRHSEAATGEVAAPRAGDRPTEWGIPPAAVLSGRLHRARLKLTAHRRALDARLRRPPLGIVGCYNTGNVGDLALAWTLSRLARRSGFGHTLQSFGRLDSVPPSRATIVGGGGILTAHPTSPLAQLAERYGDRAHQVALVGVGGGLKAEECDARALALLRGAAFFSTRSDDERDNFEALTGRRDIGVQPDIAFGLAAACGIGAAFGLPDLERPEAPNTADPARGVGPRNGAGSPVLGLSVSPVLIGQVGRAFRVQREPSAWFREHLPATAAVYDQVGARYVETVRDVVAVYRERGWHVRCIPFASEDDLFARAALRDAGVAFAPYRADPIAVLREVGACDAMLATRFHAHVFSLLAGTPVLSIAYAPKCQLLWRELGLPSGAQVGWLDLVHRQRDAVDRLVAETPAILPTARRAALQTGAAAACLRAIDAVAPLVRAG